MFVHGVYERWLEVESRLPVLALAEGIVQINTDQVDYRLGLRLKRNCTALAQVEGSREDFAADVWWNKCNCDTRGRGTVYERFRTLKSV